VKPHRIAIVIDALTLGGAQQVVVQLAQHWKRVGFEVIVIVIQGGNSFLVNQLNCAGIKIKDVHGSGILDVKSLYRLSKILNDFQPTEVHAHLYWSQVWTGLLLFKSFPLLKWVEHNMYTGRTAFQWTIYRWLSKKCVRVIAVSREVCNYLYAQAGISSITISNPITGGFKSCKRDLAKPVFVVAGRLVAQKNPSLAIKSFELALRLKLIPEKSTLLIIGQGPLMPVLLEEVKCLGIEESVQFIGAVDHDVLLAHLAKSTTLISSSQIEGDPLVRLEALASGCMVVSTSTGGISETPYGVLCADPKVEDLAHALSESLNTEFWSNESIQSRIAILESRNVKFVAERYLESFTIKDSSD
jgi:glycosyltransferase involved in cell wall biosynthesis